MAGMVFVAAGFTLVHLFGDCLDDSYNVEEDRRNKRTDKLILSGVLTAAQMRIISFALLGAGLVALSFVDTLLLLPAMWCAVLAFLYSYPKTRLKNYGISAYVLGGSVWVLTFASLETVLFGGLRAPGIFFISFAFSQYVYILCQKDSTDTKDKENLFVSHGGRMPLIVTSAFGAASSIGLLLVSAASIFLVPVWALNLLGKFRMIGGIRRGSMKRSVRGNLVLIEFLTPYLCILALSLQSFLHV